MSSEPPAPPVAKRLPHVHEAHGDRRPDDYHWLRQREDPDVAAYLEAENAYTDTVMEPLAPLREKLYAEIVARIQETDLSVPVPYGPFLYYARSVEGLQYAIHCRRPAAGPEGSDDDGPEQVLLDENVLAEGLDYCALGTLEVSPDHRLLAWSFDTEGDEDYLLRFRDLDTGEDHPDTIPGTYYGVAWADDNRTVFYTTLDEARRPWRVWRHRLGTDRAEDVLVHQEDDDRFFCSVERTRSGGYILIDLRSAVTAEVLILPADRPEGAFTTLEPRRQDVEYGVEHHGERFFILDNDAAPNFRLVEAPVADPRRDNWQEVIPHSPDVKLEGLVAFRRHLVVLERAEAVRRIRVIDLETPGHPRSPGEVGDQHLIDQPEEVCRVGLPQEDNPEFDRDTLRYTYTSLVTPQSVFDYDLQARRRTLLKQEPVLGGYDPDRYETQRLWAAAPDGVRVPISLIARRGTLLDGSAPCVLYGYGAYEASSDPRFSSLRLSLLDRGFVWAVAHVRGGGEMGRAWYEAGKLKEKVNTFTDFIACAEHLIAEGWTASDRLAIFGGSAGGLLVGAALNLRPDLFRAAVAEVPFVDVLSTISDPTLPLSVIEWEEWGDPADPEFYAVMKGYSPYDNVRPVRYPDLFVTAGLNDPRVSYWEPAKWVARLRATAEPGTRILLRTEMGAGHGGPSGRYDAWHKDAEIFAFLLDAVGLTE